MSELKRHNFDEYKIELKEPDRTFCMILYPKEQVDDVIHKLLVEIAELKGYNRVLEKRKEDDIQKSTPKTNFNPLTVKIGDTEWMAENLAYDDGGEGITYNHENKEYYYTLDATKRVANKLGWKLPSNEDWNNACEECGGTKDDEGDYNKCSLKEKLNIKLAGYYYSIFYNVGSCGYFWSSSKYSSSCAGRMYFDTGSSVKRDIINKTFGFSVRLVKEK